jgi:hypothetical protein
MTAPSPTSPTTGSRRTYLPGPRPGMRVPMRDETLRAAPARTAHFSSMRMSQDVPLTWGKAVEAGLREKAARLPEHGGRIHLPLAE